MPRISAIRNLVLLMVMALWTGGIWAQTTTFTQLSVSSQNLSLGSPITLTAIVNDLSANGTGIADGIVTFYDCESGEVLATAKPLASKPTNLIPNSDNLNLADWQITDQTSGHTASISGGASDPLGGNNGSVFKFGNAIHAIGFVGSSAAGLPTGLSGPYTFSFWMKTESGTATPWVPVGLVDQNFAVLNNWSRYSITFPALPSSLAGLKVVENGQNGDQEQNLEVWGLQLEAGSTPGPYVSTSSPRSASGGGVAKAIINVGWTTGSHSIYAVYSGSSVHGDSTSEAAWIWVSDATEMVITSTVLPVGAYGVPYQAALEVVGGQPPYTWSTHMVNSPPVAQFLPSGLTLSSDGIISGTPGLGWAGNNYSVPVVVVDSANQMAQATVNLSVGGGQFGCPKSRATVLSVVPDSGPVGTLVTITGVNFFDEAGAQVLFNGVAGTIQSWTVGNTWDNLNMGLTSTITVTVPPGASTGWITITNIGVGSEGLTPAWFVVDKPSTAAGSCIIADARQSIRCDAGIPRLCRNANEMWR